MIGRDVRVRPPHGPHEAGPGGGPEHEDTTAGFLLSRTGARPGRPGETSTHSAPSPPLQLLVRRVAVLTSGAVRILVLLGRLLDHGVHDQGPGADPGPRPARTAEYTRAAVRACDPFPAEESAQARVAARRARAHILATRGSLSTGPDEMVPRRPVGGPAVMALVRRLPRRVRASREEPVGVQHLVRRPRDLRLHPARPGLRHPPVGRVRDVTASSDIPACCKLD